MTRYLILLAAVMFCSGSYGQEQTFVSAIKENTHELELNKTNEAYRILTHAISGSQFTLIGEAHGIAEVQSAAARLYATASEEGYSAMVIETDPYCAGKVGQLAQADESETLEFATKYPMAIPFFHSAEGMDMARSIASDGGDFWGVDQVFVVAPRYLFAKLAKIAESSSANKLAADYAAIAQDDFNNAMASGNPDKVTLMKLTDEDFDALRDAFKGDGSAVEMIDQMQLSQEIYQHWYDGEYYLNNKVRSDLMKRLFLDHYSKAAPGGELPKVMFKLGSNHAVRGLSSTYIYDLGNTVSELAAINGTGSTHIRLTGARGKTFNMLAGVQEFDATQEWHPWLQSALNAAVNSGAADYLLVDFRPLRNIPMKEFDAELRDLVFGWDYWVIIKAAHPVTPLGQ